VCHSPGPSLLLSLFTHVVPRRGILRTSPVGSSRELGSPHSHSCCSGTGNAPSCITTCSRGKRLFEDGSDLKMLELVDSKAFSTGALYLTYRPAHT
jgi:hypothetical protein